MHVTQAIRSIGLLVLVLAGGLILGSCSSEPSLSEYVDEAEHLVQTMNFGLDSLEPLLGDSDRRLDDVRAYASERVRLRQEFLDGLSSLEPPDRMADMHVALVDIVARLTAAESAMAAEVFAMDEGDDLTDLWGGEAGLAALAVDAEAVAFCRAAEVEFDERDEAALDEDVLWVPAEMKEILRVAFYCDRSDRP